MKKIIVWIVSVFMATSLTACIRSWPPPYGVWHSEELNMTLFINRELIIRGDNVVGGMFPGIYIRDDEEIDIFVDVFTKNNQISIHDSANVRWEYRMISGEYLLEDGRLYLTSFNRNPETGEFDTIIFELLEEVAGP